MRPALLGARRERKRTGAARIPAVPITGKRMDMSLEEQQELEDEYVMHTFARKPVQLVSGSGMTVQDDKGNEYVDFIGGIGVCCLGHCAPVVADAIADQAHKLIHVSNYYYIEKRGQLAHMLSDMLNERVAVADRKPWKTFFANSGAEANECAIKLARLYSREKGSGGQNIISLEHSFHGRTLVTLAATQQPVKQAAFQPLPGGFLAVKPNDIAALEQTFAAHPDGIAAILLEPIQGESGVHPLSKEYLQAALKLAHDNGALLICDEVQCGIYRAGTYPFAYQHANLLPDIVSTAKGIAGGFPMGACSARAEVAEVFQPGLHGSTFGGSNLAVSASYATLNALQEQGIAQHVTEVGDYLMQQLSQVPGLQDVRGKGLMVACDLPEGVDAFQVVLKALDAGLLLNATGPSTLRFLPPLICEKKHVDALVAKLPALIAG
jgi:acetylornithine/N-succinyldiaminopimelate aminotransferase